VFRSATGTVTYLGRFALDETQPYFRMDAAEPLTDAVRQVIVFRLHPVGPVLHDQDDELRLPQGASPRGLDAVVTADREEAVISHVQIEQQYVEEVEVSRTTTSYTATRREQALVLQYVEYMEGKGSDLDRLRVFPVGEAREIVCDVWDKTRNNLIEAKGTGSRGEIRMAIGQLFDYRRFVARNARTAVLIPARPRDDVEKLLKSAGIAAIWPAGGSFADNADGRFT
jgi:hypothetical protein